MLLLSLLSISLCLSCSSVFPLSLPLFLCLCLSRCSPAVSVAVFLPLSLLLFCWASVSSCFYCCLSPFCIPKETGKDRAEALCCPSLCLSLSPFDVLYLLSLVAGCLFVSIFMRLSSCLCLSALLADSLALPVSGEQQQLLLLYVRGRREPCLFSMAVV